MKRRQEEGEKEEETDGPGEGLIKGVSGRGRTGSGRSSGVGGGHIKIYSTSSFAASRAALGRLG